MAKKFSEQATVRVWRNLKKWGIVPTSHFGHAAVTIAGTTVPGAKQHISFWPGDFASKGNATARQQGGWTDRSQDDKVSEMNRLTALRLEVGFCKANSIPYPKDWDDILQDLNKTAIAAPRQGQTRLIDTGTGGVALGDDGFPLWSQSPEVKIALPGIGSTNHSWGLSVRRMAEWWQRFKDSAPYYQALGKQNCAGVALLGLREGGAEAFVKCPGITIYGEPIQVEEYARQIDVQLDRMENWSQELDTDIRQAVSSGVIKPEASTGLVDGVWTVDVWKQKSDLGTFKVRSSTIREIDHALKDYHQANWDDQFKARYEALVKMFLQIVAHRRDKPQSGRSEAVLRLGAQILAIVRNPGPIV